MGAVADLPVQHLNAIVGVDACPVFTRKLAVGKRLLNPISRFLDDLFYFHGTQFLHHDFGFLPINFLALLSMNHPEQHLDYQFRLGARRYRKHVAVKVDGATLVLCFGKHFSNSLPNTKTLVSSHQLDPVQATHGNAAIGRN